MPTPKRTRTLAAAALAFCAFVVSAPVVQAQAQRRFAVVVGANRGPAGRSPLRYAHDDARRMLDVLTQLGGFDVGDVDVLMDPAPDAVLKALDKALANAAKTRRESLVLFYYGGYADGTAFYPQGQPLKLADVKARLEDGRAKIRVAVLDAVHSEVPLPLTSPGVVLVGASSGAGKERESDLVGGSFFTHHLTAGLRGAADGNGDGRITIGEAAKYARALTTRDVGAATAGSKTAPRPTFRGSLGGVDDFALTTLEPNRRTLILQQTQGPLDVVEIESGKVVLETQPGRRRVPLFVEPGRYRVRRHDRTAVATSDVEVKADVQLLFSEEKLNPAKPRPAVPGKPRVAAASNQDADEDEDIDDLPVGPVRPLLVAPGRWNLQLGAGFRRARVFDPGLGLNDIGPGVAGIFRAVYGLTPRWHLALPLAFAYAGGDARSWRWVPWIGIPALATGNTAAEGFIVNGHAGLGLDLVRPLGRTVDLALGGAGLGLFHWALGPIGPCDKSQASCPTDVSWASRPPRGIWTGQLSVGLGWYPSASVSLHLAVGAADTLYNDGVVAPTPANPVSDIIVAVGSLQSRGLRPLPLLRIQINDATSLDLSAVASYSRVSRTIGQTYMAALSWLP